MKTTRRVQDATPSGMDEPGREFSSDDADLLCAECLMLNRGIVRGAFFKMQMRNFPEIFRVWVTTAEEETDLEFYKLTGTTRAWRDGVELTVN